MFYVMYDISYTKFKRHIIWVHVNFSLNLLQKILAKKAKIPIRFTQLTIIVFSLFSITMHRMWFCNKKLVKYLQSIANYQLPVTKHFISFDPLDLDTKHVTKMPLQYKAKLRPLKGPVITLSYTWHTSKLN